jgi:hypothetical protein
MSGDEGLSCHEICVRSIRQSVYNTCEGLYNIP